jgi:prophage antirepressor-like protein
MTAKDIRTPPHPHFIRVSFITLNESRLFTASQVADLIEEHSSAAGEAEKVLEILTVQELQCETCKYLKTEDCPLWLCDKEIVKILGCIKHSKIKELRAQQKGEQG